MRLAAAVGAIALASAGCSENKQKSGGKPAAEGGEPAAELSPKEAERERRRQEFEERSKRKQLRRVLVAVEPSEIAQLVPSVPGATVLSPAAAQTEGRQVNQELCLTGSDVGAAVETLRVAFEGGGWSSVYSRPHRTIPDRIGMSGQKPPFRLTATVEKGQNPACPGADGKIYALLTFHKLLTPDQVKPQ
jgi:hypothetical protein